MATMTENTNKLASRELDREMLQWERWRAFHNVRPSWRAGFLIIVSGVALKVHWLLILITLIGYQICEFLDCLAKQRALDKIAGEETEWRPDPDDPKEEIDPEGASRIKLPLEHQIVVGRINDRLRRMLLV
jgi:hypothetical protein